MNYLMRKEELKIVFFGTPEFAVCSLDALVKGGFNVAAVVTMPDKVAGRGHKLIQSDVCSYAKEHELPILQPANLKSRDFIDALQTINADLFVVIAFRMLPEAVWAMPRLGTFNLHASLLPKYRGAAPINRAVMNGDEVTGVTTFFLRHEIDTGPIIDQREITVGPDENVGSVHDRLMLLGAELVVDTVNRICAGTLEAKPQPEGEFTPAPKIFKDTCRIDWNMTTRQIHNHVRGLSPYPAAWSEMMLPGGAVQQCKVLATSTDVTMDNSSAAPGTVLQAKGKLIIATADGAIEVTDIQPAGKRSMSAHDFLLGYHPESFV